MSEAMTARERLESALLGRETDRVPWSPFLAYVWEHFPAEIQALGQPQFLKAVGADPLWRGAPAVVRVVHDPRVRGECHDDAERTTWTWSTPVGTLRSTHIKSTQGHTAFLVEHPLKTPEDFKVQQWIEEHARVELDMAAAQAFRTRDAREGLCLGMLLPRGKTAFQSLVEHHVGTEELAYALADFPEVVESLWRVMVQRDLEAVRLAASSGLYDWWITWEDSSTQNYSPALYDRFIASEIGAWCATLGQHHQRYVQHACGHTRAILPSMKRQGVAAVESLSPPPTGNISLAEARAVLGGDCGLIGGIEPTEFLHLSLAQLGGYVEQVIADGRGAGGRGPFVLANSDSCPPGVTLEKFQRVGEVVRAH